MAVGDLHQPTAVIHVKEPLHTERKFFITADAVKGLGDMHLGDGLVLFTLRLRSQINEILADIRDTFLLFGMFTQGDDLTPAVQDRCSFM